MQDPNQLGFFGFLKQAALNKYGLLDAYNKQQGREQVQGLIGNPQSQYKMSDAELFPGETQAQAVTSGLPQGTDPAQQDAAVQGLQNKGAGLIGGEVSPQEFYAKLLGTSGYEQIGAQGLMNMRQAPVSPTSLMQNLSQIYPPGSPEYKKAMADYLAKPATQINMNTQKPLGADAANWRDTKGNQASPMMGIEEAYASGFTPRTTSEIKTTESTQQSSAPIAQMIKYGFGGEGQTSLFPPDNAGLMARAQSGAESWVKGATDSDNRISLYNSNQSALTTGLARLVGQVGTLTDRDVNTVKALFPTAGLTPQSLAKEKFKGIATLLMGKGVPSDKLKELGFPPWAFDEKSKSVSEMTDEELKAIANGN